MQQSNSAITPIIQNIPPLDIHQTYLILQALLKFHARYIRIHADVISFFFILLLKSKISLINYTLIKQCIKNGLGDFIYVNKHHPQQMREINKSVCRCHVLNSKHKFAYDQLSRQNQKICLHKLLCINKSRNINLWLYKHILALSMN